MAAPSNWEMQMERYLNRQMSDEESQRFEIEINDDPLKLKALQDRMQAEFAVVLTAREAEVSALKSRYQSGNAKVRNFNYGYMAVAAAVLVLVGLAIFLLPKAEFDPQAIYAANYEVPAAPHARGDNGLDSLLQIAIEFYNQKQYQAASELYEEYIGSIGDSLKSQTDFQNARLFLAISLLETNRIDQAIGQLSELIENNEIAQWYLALALLKQEKIPGAKEVLQRISLEERHFYHDRAESILALLP